MAKNEAAVRWLVPDMQHMLVGISRRNNKLVESHPALNEVYEEVKEAGWQLNPDQTLRKLCTNDILLHGCLKRDYNEHTLHQ